MRTQTTESPAMIDVAGFKLNEAIFYRSKMGNDGPRFGTFFGEVIEISDEGRSGTIVITDERANLVDTFTGKAADFQASSEWQSV